MRIIKILLMCLLLIVSVGDSTGFMLVAGRPISWLSGYTYRIKITVTNPGNNEIEVPLTNSELDFTKAQRFGEDIRFTASDGTTLLPLWRKSHDQDAQTATYWIRETTNATTVYLYYGNSSATDVSSKSDVFTIFQDGVDGDDPGDSPTGWTTTQGTDTKVYVSIKPEIKKTSIALDISSAWIDSNDTVFAGHATDGKIYKSTDGGANWTSVYTFSGGSGLIRMVWVASNDYVYASRDKSGIVVRSIDGGDNWSTVLNLHCPNDSGAWNMSEDSVGRLYVSEYSTGDTTETCAYVWKSVNNGASFASIWNNPNNDRHVHNVYVDPLTDRLYLTSGETTREMAYTDDQGSSWTTITTGLPAYVPITSISGKRFFGSESITATIDQSTDDSALTTSYTMPVTDDYGFWTWLVKDSSNNIFGGFWTTDDNVRATIVGTWDSGTTWHILETMTTGVSHRGFLGASNFDSNGFLYFSHSIDGVGYKSKLSDNRRTIRDISEDLTGADAYKGATLSGTFVVESTARVDRVNSVLGALALKDTTTDRISVIFWNDALIKYHNGTDWISTGITYTADTDYDFKYIVNLTAKTWDLWIDGVEKATDIPFRVDGNTANRFYVIAGTTQQGTSDLQDIRVREYSATEPTVSFGSEETLAVGMPQMYFPCARPYPCRGRR